MEISYTAILSMEETRQLDSSEAELENILTLWKLMKNIIKRVMLDKYSF